MCDDDDAAAAAAFVAKLFNDQLLANGKGERSERFAGAWADVVQLLLPTTCEQEAARSLTQCLPLEAQATKKPISQSFSSHSHSAHTHSLLLMDQWRIGQSRYKCLSIYLSLSPRKHCSHLKKQIFSKFSSLFLLLLLMLHSSVVRWTHIVRAKDELIFFPPPTHWRFSLSLSLPFSNLLSFSDAKLLTSQSCTLATTSGCRLGITKFRPTLLQLILERATESPKLDSTNLDFNKLWLNCARCWALLACDFAQILKLNLQPTKWLIQRLFYSAFAIFSLYNNTKFTTTTNYNDHHDDNNNDNINITTNCCHSLEPIFDDKQYCEHWPFQLALSN